MVNMVKGIFKIFILGSIVIFLCCTIDIYASKNNDLANYADDRIIVSLSNEVSMKLKNYTISDFSEYDFERVIDLTQVCKDALRKRSGNYEYCDGISTNKFNQTLCLYLKKPSFDNVKNAINAVSKRKDVVAVSPDYKTEVFNVNPDDTFAFEQWALNNINLNQAWDITTGSVAYPVKVGVIDSGIYGNHPDLSSNIDSLLSVNCCNEPITIETNPTDYYGHGTGVAGVIGAKGYNAQGIAGAIWNLKLISLKVLDGDNNYDESAISSVIRAISYATVNNIDILNYSSGWVHNENNSEPLLNPLEVVISNYPGLFVCAAGNSHIDIGIDGNRVFPANYHLSNMIVVGASNQYNNSCYSQEWGSNYSQNIVDIFAPGESIKTTNDNGGYSSVSGTSFAAPYVTGVAALIKSIRPYYSPEVIKKLILDNVDKYSSLSNLCVTGGRLNAYKAVRAATEQQTFLSDVNGDGYNDVIMSGKNGNQKRVLTTLIGNSNGNFTSQASLTSSKDFYYVDSAFCGDFNGDGRSDILIHWTNNNYRQLSVYLRKTNGSFQECVNLSSSRYHYPYQFPVKFLVMDVDNDSKDDFIVVYKNSSGKIGILVYKGSNVSPYILDATSNALNSTYDYFDDSPIYNGDFNGDGYGDILVPSYNSNEKRTLTVFSGKNTGEFNDGETLISDRNHKPYDYPYKYLIGDFSGDGLGDLVNTYRDSGFRKMIIYEGKNSTPYFYDAPFNNYSQLYGYSLRDYAFSGDVNGDNYDDIIIHFVNSNGKRSLRVFGGNYALPFEYDYLTTTTNYHNEQVYPCSIYSCDVNNDGKCDIIVKWKNNDKCTFYVYKGKSDYTFESAVGSNSTAYFYN